MKISEIIKMSIGEFKKLPEANQRGLVQSLALESNKRMSQLERSGLEGISYAYLEATDSGGRISSKGKDRTELKNEFIRAQKFLKAETSTVSGTVSVTLRPLETVGVVSYEGEKPKKPREIAQELAEMIERSEATENFYKTMWEIVDKAREMKIERYKTSEELIQEAYQLVKIKPKRMTTLQAIDLLNEAKREYYADRGLGPQLVEE